MKIKPLPQDFSLLETIFGDVDYESLLSTYSKIIIVIIILYLLAKICKRKNDVKEINSLFKENKFQNSKGKYAYMGTGGAFRTDDVNSIHYTSYRPYCIIRPSATSDDGAHS